VVILATGRLKDSEWYLSVNYFHSCQPCNKLNVKATIPFYCVYWCRQPRNFNPLSYIRLLEVCTEITLGATEARINICHQNCYYWHGLLDVC